MEIPEINQRELAQPYTKPNHARITVELDGKRYGLVVDLAKGYIPGAIGTVVESTLRTHGIVRAGNLPVPNPVSLEG